MFAIDPLTLGVTAVLWLAFRNQSDTMFGQLTPERAEVYKNALEHLKDPVRLRKLADEFAKFGLKVEAATLRKRAEWRGRTDAQRAEHDAVFARAMASENVPAILKVADIFESMTATLKAAQLRGRARALTQAAQEKLREAEKQKQTAVVAQVEKQAANAGKPLRVVKTEGAIDTQGETVSNTTED